MNVKINTFIFDIFFIIVCFVMVLQSIHEARYAYTFVFGFLGFYLMYLGIK